MRQFFADLWAKVKSDIANAFAIIGTGLGSVMAHIDDVASMLGDPSLSQQLSTVFTDAKWVGRWLLFVGLLTVAARFKKLVQSPPKE
ncbi:hypothetical protein IC762_12385 [Bradyrhizobium genosp. L]|uniref:hypothetical protein n=1 Tax=Bradyrhizobium genosp. L TaxID=83637 RepID=UPI0018A31869|nr:hypothetical protein [Bradyrhizobium genosp. L]QPF87041.1 hypothetical protein IC762_12385 [Bradyrhizobium genosp. L]